MYLVVMILSMTTLPNGKTINWDNGNSSTMTTVGSFTPSLCLKAGEQLKKLAKENGKDLVYACVDK